MNPVAKLEIAWAAGFFDGEGHTSCTASLAITVGQVNRNNLQRFMEAVNGAGKIYGPYKKGGKPIFTYQAYSDEAFNVFRAISPYLGREKLDQFLKAAIRFCFRSVRNRGGNPMCRRGHIIAITGRHPDGDCSICRLIRRSNGTLPAIQKAPTAFDFRLHGIREYVPPKMERARQAVAWSFGKEENEYAPCIET